ncbi:flagellar hook-length control protein FliK [Paenibacillus pinisoli]|uniref:flagellar hook-length control protein FliK n=1 Tax=Paenibacillus pinisoli TaxID=1276110 RepID=UPI001058E42F|nr:flagellar hook-length control protein FliK [Paenibacillus pinisoli]
MNISQMMRGLLGDAVSGETRAMELKVGQVVRGVVVQTFENNEAMIQINGVQVRAKLEMPMSAGQSAMLQVQPESNGSLVMLKAVDLSASGLLDDTFRDYAKMLGLPDQRWSLDIVKDLRREGFPFNRTTSLAFQSALAAMPRGADMEQWMTAAAAAFKRGLPMTATTIASMGQVMFGRASHELLDSLQQQLGAFMKGLGSAEAGSPAGAAQQAGARVLTLLMQGDALLRGGLAESSNGTPGGSAAAQNQGQQAPAGAQPSVPGQAAPQNGAQSVPQNASQPAMQNAAQAAVQPGSSQPAAQGAAQGASQAAAGGASGPLAGQAATAQAAAPAAGANWLGGMMKWLGVDHELQLAKAATAVESGGQLGTAQPTKQSAADTGLLRPQAGTTGGGAQAGLAASAAAGADVEAAAAAGARTEAAATGPRSEAAAMAARSAEPAAAESGRAQAAAAQPSPPHTAQVAQQHPSAVSDAASRGDQALAPSQHAQQAAAAPSSPAPAETLKNALLSLLQASDTPPAIKETAQQLIHQITGQQLLLTPERNSSVFTHVTMFIPLKDADGGTTASVHIQTRRGKRGELDADNCRLLFNLSMASLGDTLVDVNVTDKIVSLNIWNDHPAIAELVEGSRNEIAERLQGTGYQLLSLRTTPLPARDGSEAAPAVAAKDKKAQTPPDLAQFASTRYKGVDYRI